MRNRDLIGAVFIVIQVFCDCSFAQQTVEDELSIVIDQVDGPHALVWVDLNVYSEEQIVPTPNGVLRFSDKERYPQDGVNRPFAKYIAEINRLGVQRIWFCVYPGFSSHAKRAILPCPDPESLARFLTADKFLPQKVQIQVLEHAVVVHLMNVINTNIDPQMRAKWDGVIEILPALENSHGYLAHDAFYFFLSPVNEFFKDREALRQYVDEITPHVRFYYFQKTFPQNDYRITIVFDTPDATMSAKHRLTSLTAATDEKSQGIHVTSNECELHIAATTPAGERRIEQGIHAIHPIQGTQLP